MIDSIDPEIDLEAVAWTKRPNVFLRGLPAQTNRKNFIHDVINLRAVKHALRVGLPLSLPEVPADLLTDVRQQVRRQSRDGTAILLTGSLLYWYLGDRILTCEEHCFLMGYDDDLNLQGAFEERQFFNATTF